MKVEKRDAFAAPRGLADYFYSLTMLKGGRKKTRSEDRLTTREGTTRSTYWPLQLQSQQHRIRMGARWRSLHSVVLSRVDSILVSVSSAEQAITAGAEVRTAAGRLTWRLPGSGFFLQAASAC